MKISRLNVQNMRSWQQQTLQLEPGCNQLVGPNGRGKTTLLEAIGLFVIGGSFRTRDLDLLIRDGAAGFFAELQYERDGFPNVVQLQVAPSGRTALLNGASTSLLGLVPGVISTPEDDDLIKGTPTGRRRYLDLQIAQADPLYADHLKRYTRALRQRNTLLKDQQLQTIHIWEQQLVLSGSYLVEQRVRAVGALSELVDRAYEALHARPCPIRLTYEGEPPTEAAYQAQRPKEQLLGCTVLGPHRHEMTITASGHLAREWCSAGEIQLLALALKLAEWELLRERTSVPPLFLADDLAIHLDGVHLGAVCEALGTLGQVVLSTQAPLSVLGGKNHLL